MEFKYSARALLSRNLHPFSAVSRVIIARAFLPLVLFILLPFSVTVPRPAAQASLRVSSAQGDAPTTDFQDTL